MRRPTNALTALTALGLAALALSPLAPAPLWAQEATAEAAPAPVLPEGAFSVDLDGLAVICLPDKAMICPEGGFCVFAKVEKGCLKKAAEEIAAGNGPQSAPVEAEAAEGEAIAPVEAAPTEAAAPEEAVATEAATEEGVTEDGVAEEGVAEVPAEEAAAEAALLEALTAEATPAEPAEAEAPAEGLAAPVTVNIGEQAVLCLPDDSLACPEGAICVTPKSMDKCESAAQKKLDKLAKAAAEDAAALAAAQAAQDAALAEAEAQGQELIDAPEVSADEQAALDAALAETAGEGAAADAGQAPMPAAAAADAEAPQDLPPADQPVAAEATVSETTVTEEDTRAADEEFAEAPVTTSDGSKKSELSDLEKVGLFALGALIVGEMLSNDNQVVANTGDRVVVQDPYGNYTVYKDDDALLRQPGSEVRTETFADGSTRTTVWRDDGTSVVTVRDATGRVLRRTAYDANGIPTVLVDDTLAEAAIDVTTLSDWQGQKFSLRQIRLNPRVKALAKEVPVDNVTFETGSAAITRDQAREMAVLGRVLKKMIEKDPNRVFLIEGHTDAVGAAPLNLTLSDRRAESVAKALADYFDVPPENLVVQGYGESELLIDTDQGERANRRVVVRDITPLLRQTAE